MCSGRYNVYICVLCVCVYISICQWATYFECGKMTRRRYALCVKFNIIQNTQPHGSHCHYVFLKFYVHSKRCISMLKIFKSVSVLLKPPTRERRYSQLKYVILYILKNKNLFVCTWAIPTNHNAHNIMFLFFRAIICDFRRIISKQHKEHVWCKTHAVYAAKIWCKIVRGRWPNILYTFSWHILFITSSPTLSLWEILHIIVMRMENKTPKKFYLNYKVYSFSFSGKLDFLLWLLWAKKKTIIFRSPR